MIKFPYTSKSCEKNVLCDKGGLLRKGCFFAHVEIEAIFSHFPIFNAKSYADKWAFYAKHVLSSQKNVLSMVCVRSVYAIYITFPVKRRPR